MFIKFVKDYRFAHKGIKVEAFKEGQVVNASERLAVVAKKDKVAEKATEKDFEEYTKLQTAKEKKEN